MIETLFDMIFLYYSIVDYKNFGIGLKELFSPKTRSRESLTFPVSM